MQTSTYLGLPLSSFSLAIIVKDPMFKVCFLVLNKNEEDAS
jgi:hypothetical protein